MSKLANDLMKNGYLKTDLVIEAFSKVDRAEFLPEKYRSHANANISFPVGFGQIISQPNTVATMFELLDVKEGHNGLIFGTATGWTTALFAHMVGQTGLITSLEIIPELLEIAKKNITGFRFAKDYQNITFACHNGLSGYPKNAPYDRMFVSATATEIPQTLKDQLAVGGKMIIPVNNILWLAQKKEDGELEIEKYQGFEFVPLIEKHP